MQLTMLCKDQPVKEARLPEGFYIRTYIAGDAKGWIDVCAEGLDTANWSEQDFEEKMLKTEGLSKDGIFFAVNSDGKIVGTASGVLKNPENGYLHMVSIHPDFRGRGISKPLNCAVMKYFLDNGRKSVTLNTDDFRLPAIKVYLWLGFHPIINDNDMEERWLNIIEKLKLSELETYSENGELFKLLVNKSV